MAATRGRAWLALLIALALAACSSGGGSGGGSDSADDGFPSLESISVAPALVQVERGCSRTLQVTAELSDGSTTTTLSGVDWSSAEPNIAEVASSEGGAAEIAGHAIGDTTVTAELAGRTAVARIGVTAATEALQIEPAVASLPVNTSEQLSARALFADGSARDVSTLAQWTSSDPAVATLTSGGPGAGTLTGVDAGEVVAHASYCGEQATALATVVESELQSIDVTPASVSVAQGETLQLTATGTFPGGVEENVTGAATWSSDDVSVVTADGGLLTPTSAGSADVTATLDGKQDTAAVTVEAAVLDGLTIDAPAQPLIQGSVSQLTATASFTPPGPDPTVTDQVQWSSSDPAIASVSNDAGTAGQITAHEGGSVTVTATLGGISAQADLEVVADPDAPAQLNVEARPNVVRRDGTDQATIRAQVAPNDIENEVVPDTTQVTFELVEAGSATLDTASTNTIDGVASTGFTTTAAQDFVTVRVEVPSAGLSRTITLAVVDSFEEVFATGLTTDLQIDAGIIQEGSSFVWSVFNTSNRDFRIDGVTVFNDTDPIKEDPDPFDGPSEGVRLFVFDFTFAGPRTDRGIRTTLDLHDAPTSTDFSVEEQITTAP